MKNTATFALVLLLSFMFSCKTETIVCSKVGIVISGIGFTKADLSKYVILYRYKKDNAFDSLADSAKIYFPASGTDTFTVHAALTDAYDYKLLFPATSDLYQITGIAYGGNKTQSVQGGFLDNRDYVCYMQLTSYAVNSIVYTSTSNTNPIAGDTIYVRK